MPTTAQTRDNTDAAIAEVGRLAIEATRRSTEGFQATLEMARGLFDDYADISRRLFEAWVNSGEAALRATFEVQNAALASSLALLETACHSQQALLQQWQSAIRDAQEASLDTFRATTRLAPRT